MLTAFSPYSPQALLPQFQGQQTELAPIGSNQQGPFGGPMNPFLHSPWLQNPVGYHGGFAAHGGTNLAQQVIQTLGQLAQQIAVQSAVAQQIGLVVQQLAQQLATQGLQGQPGNSFGAGQAFGGSGQPFGGVAPSFGAFGAQPFGQGGFGGFNPQAQGWGANRQQTIQ
jgi:hypothetical protein